MPSLNDGALQVDVDPAVHAAHPSYVALVLAVSGIANGPSDSAGDAQLAAAEAAVRASGLTRAADHPHLAAWRSAFSSFGAKPSKYPSSAEALVSRVLRDQALPRINVLVDLYNTVSLRYFLPLGGEDTDRLEGPLRLRFATGDEPFDPRESGAEPERVAAGEVVWGDDLGVTCRRWNWRQGHRTQLTTDTTRAFFVFDRLEGLDLSDLHRAADDLSELVRDRFPDCVIDRVERAAAPD